MKNKTLPTIYRIFAILTFLCGSVMMFWFGKFANYAIEDADIEDKAVAGSIGNFGYSFFIFLAMTAICFILSIICFRASKKASSVIRTFFTGVAVGICIPAVRVTKAFIEIKKFYVDNEINLDYVADYDMESEVYKMFLPIAAYVIILVIFITSIVALVRGPVICKESLDGPLNKTE